MWLACLVNWLIIATSNGLSIKINCAMLVCISMYYVKHCVPSGCTRLRMWLCVSLSVALGSTSSGFIGIVAVAACLANPTLWLWLHMQVDASVLTVAENSPVALKAVWLWLQVAISSCGR